MNDYFDYGDYFDYFDDVDYFLSESEDSPNRCVTPTLHLYTIYAYLIKSSMLN